MVYCDYHEQGCYYGCEECEECHLRHICDEEDRCEFLEDEYKERYLYGYDD